MIRVQLRFRLSVWLWLGLRLGSGVKFRLMCKFWLGSPYLTKLGALTQLHVWLQVQYMFSVSSMG